MNRRDEMRPTYRAIEWPIANLPMADFVGGVAELMHLYKNDISETKMAMLLRGLSNAILAEREGSNG